MLSPFRNLVHFTKTAPAKLAAPAYLAVRKQSGGDNGNAGGNDGGNSGSTRWLERAALISVGCVISYGASNLFVWKTESPKSVVDTMREVFEKGGVDGWDVYDVKDKKFEVVRDDAAASALKAVLRPSNTKDGFAVVVGASGTGKTTVLRKAIRDLEGPKGVVYFSAPQLAADFSAGLAKALGYRVHTDPLDAHRAQATAAAPREEPEATWSRLAPALKDAASAFFKKHGRPAVVVLDAMDLLAKKKPAFFTDIQQFAKECGDDGILFFVLTFSAGAAPNLLFTDSSKSRACKFIELGDVKDEQAESYLVGKFGMDKKRAEAMVEDITGGRFALMNVYGEDKDTPLDSIAHVLNVDTNDVLMNVAKVPPTAKLFRELVSSSNKALDADVAHQLEDMEKVKLLLQKNIIAHHPNKTYTFHSRHVENFVRAKVEAGGAEQEVTPVVKRR